MSNMMSYNNAYEKIVSEQSEAPVSEYEFRLSNDICEELTRTVNSFTSIMAKIVKRKGATEELYDKFQNSYAKIKNLIDAAKNTNLKKS